MRESTENKKNRGEENDKKKRERTWKDASLSPSRASSGHPHFPGSLSFTRLDGRGPIHVQEEREKTPVLLETKQLKRKNHQSRTKTVGESATPKRKGKVSFPDARLSLSHSSSLVASQYLLLAS